MKTDKQVIEYVKKCRKEWERNGSAQRTNTRQCRAFVSGDYSEYVDKIQFSTPTGDKKRVTVRINKVEPYVSAVVGFFIQNREQAKYLCRMTLDGNDQQKQIRTVMQSMYAKYSNGLRQYLRENANADQVESQQDRDQISCGLGVVETALTYGEGFASRSKNGEVSMTCHDLDTFWYDASARAAGLLDARFMSVRKEFYRDDALQLFEDSKEGDFQTNETDSDSDEYEYDPNLGSYDRVKYDWASKDDGMINVDFFQWYEVEPYWRAENPMGTLQNPESVQAAFNELQMIAQEFPDDPDFDPADEILSYGEDVRKRLKESFGDFLDDEEFRRKCFYTAVMSGEKLFRQFKSEHQDGFSLKVKTGKWDAKQKIWIGIVNSMMEPQKYYNKAVTELLFIIAANSKGGVIIEEDAVEDIEEFEDQYAKTDAACVVRSGALANGKVKDKRSPHQPTGYEQIIQLADAAIPDSSGIDKNFLGSNENQEVAAQLDRQRIRRVKAILAIFVDAQKLYEKEHARLMLDLMRIWAQNNRGELFHIIGESGAKEYIVISDDKLSAEFDVIIENAPVTQEERQLLADKLTAIGDKLVMAQDTVTAKQFYAFAAKYMSLDFDDLQEIRKLLVPDAQEVDPAYVQQLEQMVQQLQSQITQVEVLKKAAETDKIKAETKKTLEELPDVRAGVHQKAADTAKKLQEAEKVDVETKILVKTGGKPQTKQPDRAST